MYGEKTATSWTDGFVKCAAEHGVVNPEEVDHLLKIAARLELATQHPDAFVEGAKAVEKQAGIGFWGGLGDILSGGIAPLTRAVWKKTRPGYAEYRRKKEALPGMQRQQQYQETAGQHADIQRQIAQSKEKARWAGMTDPQRAQHAHEQAMIQDKQRSARQFERSRMRAEQQQKTRQMYQSFRPQQGSSGRGGYYGSGGGSGGFARGGGFARRWSPSPYSYGSWR